MTNTPAEQYMELWKLAQSLPFEAKLVRPTGDDSLVIRPADDRNYPRVNFEPNCFDCTYEGWPLEPAFTIQLKSHGEFKIAETAAEVLDIIEGITL